MSAFVRFDGLDELRAALRAMPDQMRDEAVGIVRDTVGACESAIAAEYTDGELRQGLTQTEFTSGTFGIGIDLKNKSRFAWLWDNGSKLRHWKTKSHKSSGAEWGQSAPQHTFVRNVVLYRARMYSRLAAMASRVTGSDVTVSEGEQTSSNTARFG